MFKSYKNKKVLITGHTGFKGSWLSAWLIKNGADVYGISDEIPTEISNFSVIKLEEKMQDFRLDLLDKDALLKKIDQIEPDYVFHLAAQALVRPSYEDPLQTIKVNSIGTANILEVLRVLDRKVNAIMITSDKAYDNVEWIWGYKETDSLGGKDPYSASKGMAELVIKTYFNSFFNSEDSNVRLAITRAGNVIGGGDWALDRIVPDCIKAWAENESVVIRNPQATRPWQHVLEPLGGYLLLGSMLDQELDLNGEAFNFGPSAKNNFSVKQLIEEMQNHWSNVKWEDGSKDSNQVYEANLLRLNCEKSQQYLDWAPSLNFEETIEMTVTWYREYYENNDDMLNFCLSQIQQYEDIAISRGASWIQNS